MGAAKEPSSVLYVPHYHCSDRWFPAIAVANPSDQEVTVKVQAWGSDGHIAATELISQPARGQMLRSIRDIFDVDVGTQVGVRGGLW